MIKIFRIFFLILKALLGNPEFCCALLKGGYFLFASQYTENRTE